MAEESTKVWVAVHEKAITDGAHKIRQTVYCDRADMHRQHEGWDGCDWTEVTGQHEKPHPNLHAIHPETKKLIERVVPLSEIKRKKGEELFHACRASIADALMDPSKDFMVHRAACLAAYEKLEKALQDAATEAAVLALKWTLC